jgi:DNA (cytosine-5)-methyltransferase 1
MPKKYKVTTSTPSKPLKLSKISTISQGVRRVVRDEPKVCLEPHFLERKVISLFSGAMGLDLGLQDAGLHIAVSQDIDPWCVETMRRNTTHQVIKGDIRKLMADDPSCHFLLNAAGLKRQDVFAIVGGPPCQAYSTAGKRLGQMDERGGLYEQFIHAVDKLRPRFFVMENVKGLVSVPSILGEKTSDPLLSVILSLFKKIGYHTTYRVLDAVHYGVPQFRERLVIIGSRDNESVFMPAPTHFQIHQDHSMRWQTLQDCISEMEENPGPCASFTPKIEKYLRMVPEGGNWRSLPEGVVQEAMGGAYESGGGKVGFYRRLKYREPSPTLVTSPIQKATILCHPRKIRPLSVAEYMKIQQFPDWWKIQGKVVDCYRQIGNAVPLGLGRAIGSVLLSVATGKAEIKVKRTRGTSVHTLMSDAQEMLL